MLISEQQARSLLLATIVEHFNCSSLETAVQNKDLIMDVKSSVMCFRKTKDSSYNEQL